MNTNVCLRIVVVILLSVAPVGTQATIFFSDNFANGSTTNKVSVPGGTPVASSTSYDFASSKNTTTSTIGPNLLSCRLASGTTSGYWEVQALFTTNAVSLNSPGDYIELDIVFTNSIGVLFTNGAPASAMWIGLYNSGAAPGTSNPPVANALLANGGLNTTAGSPYATGNCRLWAGYVGQVRNVNTPNIITRPVQNGTGTTSANQELLGNGVSGGTFNNPGAANLITGTAQTFTLAMNTAYTLDLQITLDPAGSGNLLISNTIYSGAGTGGTMVFVSGTSTANILATAFDGLAFGYFEKTLSLNPQMDVSSITITGQSSPPVPPSITTQPSPVLVAAGGSCAFSIAALGNSLTYQWHRTGTNLLNGGNISGATSSQLVISPAGTADVLSGANGYYVTVFGAGGLSTNSVTNSLTIVTATNLAWTAAGGNTWDVGTTVSWQDPSANPEVFIFGDPVTFDDTAGGGFVNLTGSYLSPASVTLNSTLTYTFQGSGSIAGPCQFLYEGSGQLTLNAANTYSGGTIISNAGAHVYLQNYAGLGTGPVTLGLAGGMIEAVNAGSAGVGINGNVIVNDDFAIQVDATSSFGCVFLGDLSGVPGKTLTMNVGPANSGVARVRAYGANTMYNADLNLNSANLLWATYQASGSQTYNGVISGLGAMMQKGTITYFNGANTYSGGMNISSGAIGLGVDSVGSPGSVTSGPIGTGPLLLTVDSTTSTTGSGQVFATGGARTIANAIQYPTGTNNLTLVVGGMNDITFSGGFSLNGNDNTTSASITTRTIQVTNTAATTISGAISDGGLNYGLTKTGPGSLYLNGVNTYTGVTTNNSTTTIAPGLLAGNGSIAGSVVVQTNSSIGGGPATAIGTLSIGGNLTLAGNGFFRVNRAGPVSDEVSVVGTAANVGAGTITVTNLGAALQVGDTFTLFNKPVTGGAALTVTGGGTIWTNMLAVNGTIQVLSAFTANYPTNITFSVSGSTLNIGWPATHLGWILQSQTNALSIGLTTSSNTWNDVAGTGSGTNASMTISPTNPTVFFRLRHP